MQGKMLVTVKILNAYSSCVRYYPKPFNVLTSLILQQPYEIDFKSTLKMKKLQQMLEEAINHSPLELMREGSLLIP